MNLADMLSEINQLQRSCVGLWFYYNETLVKNRDESGVVVSTGCSHGNCLIYKTKGVLVVVMTVAHIVSSATVCFIWLR